MTFEPRPVTLEGRFVRLEPRAALLRIGAKEEGAMRNHIIVQPSGRRRHSVYFSVIGEERPEVKTHLECLLPR